ncbi:acyl-CoA N-acyltransferase [Wolfiporia cocos MD-104 SS10]|uniref:Histone acetyltransferase type B catalytic subunit n=1 Tax=Wolfiporia cocos (strain MD-104) TaxID=742152 RepID=A0A2H3J812_WOLCO|nr:acyl-CoA N-acyltransferase [Wolfiporia cocos MD-104 SS10]
MSPRPPAADVWTVDANEALRLSLVRAKDDKASLSTREAYEGFHPTFTYPMFGEDEKIYGYRDLSVDLKFASGSLATHLSLTSSAMVASTSARDNVLSTLTRFLPPPSDDASCATADDFSTRVEADALAFRPHGDCVFSYSRPVSALGKGKARDGADDGKAYRISPVLSPEDAETVEFEVYHSTWATPGFRAYHRRMQLFVLLYIEAGSYIKEDEEGWEFMVLYEKRTRRSDPSIATYHFVGYATLYPFYCFPERVRMRISQFLILPPYQQEGHGSALYTAIYQHVLARPEIAELTVEDPAEAFEDLRDRNDLKMLLGHPLFMSEAGRTNGVSGVGGEGSAVNGEGRVGGGRVGRPRRRARKGQMGPPANRAWVEKWRVELKLAARQFHRLVEMLMLRHLDPTDVLGQRAYRLQVKERLYRFNFEMLAQLDLVERQRKLEETFRTVKGDYERILALVTA